ncbi:SDR family NAD(P)-dependent oxidoreductase [Propionispira raffinosivorans]|uniref:SDR family NAD(P)-dependent oxidoreductase n=1 Tax=Propionispira raffinosivorans TaxID=86959 RepID=UPI00036ABF4D|nr:SDR family oxidoreductase [Propionispira raffinosivorans]
MKEVIYDFSGKRFVITGASSGMGRQIAMELAEAGALILGLARGENKLRELSTLYPMQIKYAACDVTDKEALEIAVCKFVNENGKLNGVVHAAGISDITPIKMYNEKVAHEIMDISFWAGANLIQICTKNKYGKQGMSNILFSSICAHSAEKGMFAYAGAKAALQIGAKSIAKEIAGKHHRINTITPGWVKTNMTDQAAQLADLEKFFENNLLGEGSVDDVSGIVLFLLSDRARWITGTDIVVDGGYLA